MEATLQLEQACADNNHEVLMSVLNSIPSFNSKKQALLKIIEYYERKSIFPVGYITLLIKWLLQKNDRLEAMDYILKCFQNGVANDQIAHMIYENLIKENEVYYKDNFNRNLQLLQKHNVLISKHDFVFEQIKKNILLIANYLPPAPDNLKEELLLNDKKLLLVDILDMEMLVEVLNIVDFTYLVYSDLQQIYYMLLFEDYSELSDYIEQRRIIFFDGTDEMTLNDFFLNPLVQAPDNMFGMVNTVKYDDILENIIGLRAKHALSAFKQSDEYYKNIDHEYYEKLFLKDPAEIKIMLISSETTEVNKFIAKNWYQAFLELGYQAKLHIEKNPYELVTSFSIYTTTNMFRPDIVFHINWTADGIYLKSEITNNILWIMRYRDSLNNPVYDAKPGDGYNYFNMFFLPIFVDWLEKMKSIGIPENRILNISDGVNINLLPKKDETYKQYACDIVAINNSGGSEFERLKFYIGLIGETIEDEATMELFKNIVLEQFDKLKEEVNDESNIFLTYDSAHIIDSIKDKLLVHNMEFSDYAKGFMSNFIEHMMDCLCRGRIIEWIIDSGITSNIKLWGKGWVNHDKFKKFNMGMATHGEELAAIYRNSTISISDTPWALHERTFEIFASGGFPLIRHVKCPEVENPNRITNYFKEDEEIVLFRSKDELLNKIQYFLDNPDERNRIAEKGRQVVINDFSHVAIARKTMNFIKDYYK